MKLTLLIATVVTNAISPVSVKMSADQSSVLWLSPEPLGHRPRSYSADIPYTSNREHDRFQHSSDLAFESSEVQTREQSEFGSREHYGRRYSISVTSEARKPTRILQPPNWSNSSFSNLNKWPEVEASDQPMDLRIIRDNTTDKPKQEYHIAISNSPALTVAPQEDNTLETRMQLSPETCLGEHYQQKLLPVLSPQALAGYDSGGDNSSSDAGLASVTDEHQSYNTSIFLPRTSILYMPDANTGDTQLTRKEMEVTDDQPSPEALDYAACSPVTPPPIDENSYYYTQENLVGGQSTISPEEMPPSSRGHHAEFIVPSTSSGLEEGRCICRICNKIFSKSSQLRLHVNIHYFERPFRCDNCAVSFRTKGHLQKHKRSVSHYNKVNMNMTFGTPTVDNPRPFKCADCKIAFRIHGHLAKHLRSKMHIMKLECLGKLPFGMYAEMERSGVSLNEIDTTDCNNSLESLQVMAQRLYQRDPRRMRWHNPDHTAIDPESAKSTTPLPPVADAVVMSELPVNSYTQACAIGIPAPSMINLNQNVNSGGEVKQEPSELESFRTTSSFSDGENPVSPTHQYSVNQSVGEMGQETPKRIEAEGDSDISLHRSCTCHLCGRLFKSAKFLQVHLYCDHVGWNPPSTGEVPQESSAASPSHSAVTQNLICDLCGKHFSNQNILQQHLLSHAQPRPFVCEVCDAGFTSSALLVAHLATHEHIGASGSSEATLVQLR